MSGSDVGTAEAVSRLEVGSIVGLLREDCSPVVDSDLSAVVARSKSLQGSRQEVE